MAKARVKDEAEEAAGGSGKTGEISAMEAVRRAVRELGYDAETQKVSDHIRKRFNKTLSNNMVSSYKSIARREAGVAKSRGGRRAGRLMPSAVASIQMKDLQTIKDLVSRLGPDNVRELIDVLD